MQKTTPNFPFSTSFQFREDERAGLEALFERVFFDRAFEAPARQALARTLYKQGSPKEKNGHGRPVSADPAGESRNGARGPNGTASTEDDARYVLLCRGLNGVGKTRIFRHLRESAQERNISVYEVYHHEVEGIPFKPFLHAIRRILTDHDPGAVLQKKYRYVLEHLIPDVFDCDDGDDDHAAGPQGGSLERFEAHKVRIFDAISQLLLEVTTRKPLLLLIHDLHWSDRSTIELLRYIGRNLQLRNTAASPHAPGQLSVSAGSGPELEGFENEEWRALARKTAQLAGYLEGVPRAEDGEHGQRNQPLPARLLILANYRGFPDKEHSIERAVDELGSEPFAYHSELQVLGADEASRFIRQSIEGVEISGHPLEVPADGVEAIFEAAEGFPSFMHELFRALYLHSVGAEENGSMPWIWGRDRVQVILGQPTHLTATEDDEESAAEGRDEKRVGDGISVFPPPPDVPRTPLGRRHDILSLRLRGATPLENRLLEVLAVAKRPLSFPFLANVLSEAPIRRLLDEAEPQAGEEGGDAVSTGPLAVEAQPGRIDTAELADVLQALEERGLVEKRQLATDGAGEEGYFFHLWDYTRVVEKGLASGERRELHQRIGEEFRTRLETVPDEAAFEVYYHLYRGVDPRSSLDCGRRAARRFWASFALEKARQVETSLLGLLTRGDDVVRRIQLLEETARISLALKDVETAETALHQVHEEGAAILSNERRLELLFLETEALATRDPGRALKILARAPKLLAEENSRSGAELQLMTARVRLQRQDIKRAINFCLKGVRICQKLGQVPELGELYLCLGTAFYRKGDYAHAVDNYERALTSFEELGLKEASVRALDELGRVYLERGHYFRAARYLYKALEIRRRLHDVAGLCTSYDQLALVYLRSGDDLKAIENLNRTLLLRERTGDFAGLNPTLATLGDLYQRLGNYERSIFYFKWEVENSQRLGDTEGLVEAFAKLGRTYFELGDLRQAAGLCKQVTILSSEFKLRAQEADGALLQGQLLAFERNWSGAEKSLKQSAEVHGKLGHRRRESGALLELAALKLSRELYDEALKLASKGQIHAEEVKARDLQVRALTLKGEIHRFHKGGNEEKASEFLQKALELGQSIGDASVLFQLFYALAKLFHAQREFSEAANYYGKAELILKKVGDELSDDLSARFFEDKRRKVFAEDLARFRKESVSRAGRGGAASGVLVAPIKERPSGVSDYKELSARVVRLHAKLNTLHFHDHLLNEALELASGDRGFVLRVQNRQYLPVAFKGFGKNPAQHPEFMAASHVAQDAIRRGQVVLSSGNEEGTGRRGRSRQASLVGLVHRSVLCVPFMTDERIFGGVYLDKPLALGRFASRDQSLLKEFSEHCAVALNNRREFETAIREPLTGLYTPSYFVERLHESYRWFNLHGRGFAVLAYYLPGLEEIIRHERSQLGGRLAQELAEVLPFGVTMCWGSPVLYALLEESDAPLSEQISGAVAGRLESLLNEEVPRIVLPAEGHYQQGAEIYFEARHRLLPQEFDQRVVAELRGILNSEITLRDAKRILERHKIEMTLRKTGGNITHAAKELGIHRPQLSNLLKKHSLKRELFEPSALTDVESEGSEPDLEATE
jgi:tetratricopeptide (TPR) repeat protein